MSLDNRLLLNEKSEGLIVEVPTNCFYQLRLSTPWRLPLIEVAAAVNLTATDEILVAACGGKTALEAAFHAGVQQFYHWSVVLLFVVFCHVVCFLINNLINNVQYDAHKTWHSQCRVNAVFAACVPGLCGMSIIWW